MGNWIWWAVAALVLFFLLKPSAPAKAVLTAGELRDWMTSKKDLQLIDVRSSDEFNEGHLAGARLLPLNQLGSRLKELDSKRPLVVYCRSGSRSSQALKILLDQGFPEAKHLKGGIMQWAGDGLPYES